MQERLREKPPKKISQTWQAIEYLKLWPSVVNIEFDLSKVSPTTHKKLLKLIDMYPEHPGRGYGYRSEAGRLFSMLSDYHSLPKQHVNEHVINLSGLTDEDMWNGLFDLCYADAVAKRMVSGSEYQMRRLINTKEYEKARGELTYYWGTPEFYKSFVEMDLWKQASEWLREKQVQRLEKMYETAAFGGLVRFQY